MISLITESVCPICSEVTEFRHLESHNSPVKLQKACRHAAAYTQDGADISVEWHPATQPPHASQTAAEGREEE
jgi:hypothetical protein